MTTTPPWLYYLFATLMLAVAAYDIVLLLLSGARRRLSGWDVEISHVFMGMSMSGMFVAQWAFGRNAMWELIFAVLLIWFLVRSIQSVQEFGLHVPHWMIHAVMNFAMLLMYWYPIGSSSSGSMSMSVSSPSTAARVDPGLAFLLASTVLASAVFTLASPNKGATHHGTHFRVYAMTGVAGSEPSDSNLGEGPGSGGDVDRVVAAPWLEDMSHIVMCVAMGFMLILML